MQNPNRLIIFLMVQTNCHILYEMRKRPMTMGVYVERNALRLLKGLYILRRLRDEFDRTFYRDLPWFATVEQTRNVYIAKMWVTRRKRRREEGDDLFCRKKLDEKRWGQSRNSSFSFSTPLVAYFSRNETKLIPSTAGSNHAHRSSQLYHGRSSFSLFSPRGALLFFPRNISPSSGQGFDTRKVVEKRVKDATLSEHRGQLGRLEEPWWTD